MSYEKTLGIISPKCLPQATAIIESSGLAILREKMLQLSDNQAERFLQMNGLASESQLKSALTTGPVHLLIIGGLESVLRWPELIGQADQANNCVLYGSGGIESASRDIRFFFPDGPLILEQNFSAEEYLGRVVKPLLMKGLVKMCRERPENPVLWLGMWLLENRPHEM
ncbi:hypothetical protein JTE90_021929 [Oedothorax gibbosus]|uniref:Nucleoside diphosphate kinase-like domain-containing protein n=1 Tax=Oedothorax gibbosus TaxID=931172 RepID=A0AAV6VU94_9ARAC|nr:hypothetical protein JTE90_021929 [Oedothorax gibbosus]